MIYCWVFLAFCWSLYLVLLLFPLWDRNFKNWIVIIDAQQICWSHWIMNNLCGSLHKILYMEEKGLYVKHSYGLVFCIEITLESRECIQMSLKIYFANKKSYYCCRGYLINTSNIPSRLGVVLPLSSLQTNWRYPVLSAEGERKETGSFLTSHINMKNKERKIKNPMSFHWCYCVLVPLHTWKFFFNYMRGE